MNKKQTGSDQKTAHLEFQLNEKTKQVSEVLSVMSDILKGLKDLKDQLTKYQSNRHYGQDASSKQGIGGNVSFGPPMQNSDPRTEIFPDAPSHAGNGTQTNHRHVFLAASVF